MNAIRVLVIDLNVTIASTAKHFPWSLLSLVGVGILMKDGLTGSSTPGEKLENFLGTKAIVPGTAMLYSHTTCGLDTLHDFLMKDMLHSHTSMPILHEWKQRQALIELLPDGSQGRHPGTFPPRRWEDRVFQLIDTEAFKNMCPTQQRYSNWRELAQDRDLYRSVVQTFLQTVG